jgi:3-hydroxybutyryl-CoA dehydratase
MKMMHAEVGDAVRFSKTVGETDVYLLAGVTGDFSGNHVNEEFMKKSKYGRRIAHGALLVGYMSTASTLMIERGLSKGIESTPVALGYDRVRFLNPVFLGDSVNVTYTISDVDEGRRRTRAQVDINNQSGLLAAVAEQLIKWVPNEIEGAEAALPPITEAPLQ